LSNENKNLDKNHVNIFNQLDGWSDKRRSNVATSPKNERNNSYIDFEYKKRNHPNMKIIKTFKKVKLTDILGVQMSGRSKS